MISFEDHKVGQAALLEHIESLKKQLQESAALAALLQAEIEHLQAELAWSETDYQMKSAEIDQLKARCDELEHRASDVVEGFDGEQLPGAMTMRIRKLKAALSKPTGSEKV